MGSFSIWHWMLFIGVALLLFGGKGKISDIMGDMAKGIKSFKKGMADDEGTDVKTAASPVRTLETGANGSVDGGRSEEASVWFTACILCARPGKPRGPLQSSG